MLYFSSLFTASPSYRDRLSFCPARSRTSLITATFRHWSNTHLLFSAFFSDCLTHSPLFHIVEPIYIDERRYSYFILRRKPLLPEWRSQPAQVTSLDAFSFVLRHIFRGQRPPRDDIYWLSFRLLRYIYAVPSTFSPTRIFATDHYPISIHRKLPSLFSFWDDAAVSTFMPKHASYRPCSRAHYADELLAPVWFSRHCLWHSLYRRMQCYFTMPSGAHCPPIGLFDDWCQDTPTFHISIKSPSLPNFATISISLIFSISMLGHACTRIYASLSLVVFF